MSRCHACFTALPDDYASWVCTSRKCSSAADEHASQVAGYPVTSRPITALAKPEAIRNWQPPAGVQCSACNEPTSARVCPYCHYGPLLADWMSANTTCVAMTGARDSGKSVYIAIAIQQLRLLGTRLGITVDFADDETKANYRKFYEKTLLEERKALQHSADVHTLESPTRRPLIFSLGLVGGRRQYLVLRDIAGEALERESAEGIEHLRFLANADTVLFMFDPVKVTTIKDLLHDLIPEPTTESGDPRAVLNNVLRMIGYGNPRLAIVLAKFDTMELLRKVSGVAWSGVMSNAGAAMLRDPSMSGSTYDEHDGGLLDQEVRSLLLRLHANDLVTALERPTNGHRLLHRYFAVSVLGESIRSENVSSRGIKPFRCLDPLRWALAATGAM